MLLFQFAVATKCFEQPLQQSLRSAAECGACGVQFDVRDELHPDSLSETGRRQFLHRLEELGLKVASVSFPAQRPLSVEDQLELRLATIRKAMQFTYDLGARVMTIRAGRIPTEPHSQEARLLHDVLSDLARHGNHVGVLLSLTPTHDAPETMKQLLTSITAGPLGINFDPGAFAMAGQNAVDAYRSLYPLVTHITARDGIRDVDGNGVEMAVGRGEVDWPELLALWHEAEYRGWVTVHRTQGSDRSGDARRALLYLQRVMFGE